MSPVRVLSERDVREALDMASCIDACERAFVAYSSGGAELPGVIHLDVPEAEGEIHVKAGHLHGEPYYAVKVASGFYRDRAPAIDGMVSVFDARDGSLAAARCSTTATSPICAQAPPEASPPGTWPPSTWSRSR